MNTKTITQPTNTIQVKLELWLRENDHFYLIEIIGYNSNQSRGNPWTSFVSIDFDVNLNTLLAFSLFNKLIIFMAFV